MNPQEFVDPNWRKRWSLPGLKFHHSKKMSIFQSTSNESYSTHGLIKLRFGREYKEFHSIKAVENYFL